METVLLKERMQEPILPISLLQEILVADTLCILREENSIVMIPSLE